MVSRFIMVKVSAGAKQNQLTKLSDNQYKLRLTSLPQKGRANRQLIKIMAKELGVRQKQIEIIKGEKNKEKLIKIT